MPNFLSMPIYLVFATYSFNHDPNPAKTTLQEICATENIAEQTILQLKLEDEFNSEYFIEKWYVKY